MKKTETHEDSDRYQFDFYECSSKKGYAQIDTDQDAWYYGHWANPTELKFVGYCEGDVTRIQFDNPAEFCQYIRQWCENAAHYDGKRAKIDALGNPPVITAFKKLRLDDLLH